MTHVLRATSLLLRRPALSRRLLSAATALRMAKWTYPSVRRDDSVTENHFGRDVADPYRWLEDPDSEETRAFVAAQNSVSQPYLAACEVRDKFKERCVCVSYCACEVCCSIAATELCNLLSTGF